MASDIGNVYLDVYADASALKRQIRAAAKEAGKDFGKEFDKSVAPGLSAMGDRLVRDMGKNGRLSGKQFVNEFRKESVGIAKGFDEDIAKSFATGDWEKVFANFRDLDEAIDSTDARLREMNKGGALTKALEKYGFTLDDVRGSMKAYGDQARETGEETKRNSELEKDAADAAARHANNQQFLARALKEAEDSLRKQNEELGKGRQLRAAQDTAKLRVEQDNLRDSLRESTNELNRFGKTDATKKQLKDAKELSASYADLEKRLKSTLQQHNIMTAGMDKNSNAFIRATNKQRIALAALDKEMQALNKRKSTLKIDLDAPNGAKVAAEGNRLGRLFKAGFKAGAAKLGDGIDFDVLGAFKSRLTSMGTSWQQFTQGFNQGITFILNNLIGLIGPISVLASLIGGVLVAGVSSLYVAIVGLGAAAAGVFAGIAVSVLLAVNAFKSFKDEFPATYAAINGIRTAFNDVAVPAFAKAWSDSVKGFGEAVTKAIDFKALGASLGAATSTITNAFTSVVESPAFTGFMEALTGPLARAVANLGTGLSGVFGIVLQWMTAAAPLAEALTAEFSGWATAMNAFLASSEGQAALTNFLALATDALSAIFDLLPAIGGLFQTIFVAGAATGTEMFQVITGLVNTLNEWLNTDAGSSALQMWLDQSLVIFNALLPVLGTFGQALGALNTPETVQFFLDFLGGLNAIIPVVGQFFLALEQSGAIALIGQGLSILAAALGPLMPTLSAVATILGQTLATALTAITPVIVDLAASFAPLLSQIGALASVVITALVPVITALAPLFSTIFAAIEPLIPTIGQLVTMIGGGLVQVFAALQPVFAALGPVINVLLQALMPLIPIFVTLIQIVANLVASILPPLMPVLAAIGTLFAALAPVIAEIGGKIAGLLVKAVELLAPILVEMVPVIMSLVEAFMPFVDVVFDLAGTLLDALAPILMAILPIIADLAPTVVQLVIAFVPVLRVIQLLAPVLNLLLPPLSDLIVWLLKLITPLLDLIEPILTFVVQLFAMKGAVGDIMKGLQTFAVGVAEVAGKIGQFFGKIGEGLASFLGKFGEFFTSIGANISGFITKIVTFGENIVLGLLNGLTGAWASVVTWFTGVVESLINLVKGLFGINSPSTVFLDFGMNIIQGLLDGLISMASAVGTFFSDLFTTIGQLVVDGITAYITFWAELPGKIIDAISTLAGLVGTWIGEVWASIVTIGTAAWNTYITFWTELPGKIIGFVSPLLGMIGEWIAGVMTEFWNREVTGFTRIAEFFAGIPGKVISAVSGLLGQIQTFGSDVITRFKTGLTNVWENVMSWVREIPGKITGAITGAATLLYNIGRDVIQGLINGIKSLDPLKIVGGIATDMVNKVKGILKIGSPSKVFKEIGVDTVQGLVNGLDESRDKAHNAVERLVVEIQQGIGNPNESSLVAYVQAVGNQLDGIWQQYEDTSDHLKDANADLKDLIKDREAMVKSVSSHVTGELDLTAGLAKTKKGSIAKGQTTIAGIGRIVAEMKAKAGTFNSKMKSLISMGFSPQFVQMIAGYGLDEAIEIAGALERGTGGERSQIQNDFNDIFKLSDEAGNAVAGQMFDIGIAVGQGLVAGLESQQAHLEATAKLMGQQLAAVIKRELGIASPSKVFKDIGTNVMIGLDIGLTRASQDVIDTVKSISQDVTSAFAPSMGTNVGSAASFGVNPLGVTGAQGSPAVASAGGTTVAAGAIQIVTPVKDPAIVASMVLDGLVAKAL